MANRIKAIDLNIHHGTLKGLMEFGPGLTIISGENGTLKTKLLQQLKSGGGVTYTDPTTGGIRVQAISPKRNSERRAAEGIIQHFRSTNRTWDTVRNERMATQINDATFDNYPSLGDLVFVVFEDRSKDGGDRVTHMNKVTGEFNEVIQRVFPQYQLIADWDTALGAPLVKMRKHGRVEFPIQALSLGEQEVLALIAMMNANKDSTDVYLVDEPEVHLNWHLEERLFSFFDDLCTTSDKQAIVVTHSRTIFKARFLPKVTFLTWSDEGKVTWGKDLTPEQKQKLAGDAVEIVALGKFDKPTFFVEDLSHETILRALAAVLGVAIGCRDGIAC